MIGATRPALLALEDGSRLPGRVDRAGHPLRRGGLQHLDDRLPGDPHRPFLPRPDRRDDPAAHRQLRRGAGSTRSRRRPGWRGFVARQLHRRPSSNRRQRGTSPTYLRRHRVPALDGIDTRALVRRLRERGAMRGVVTSERSDVARAARRARRLPAMAGRALVDEVILPRGPGRSPASTAPALPPGGLRLRHQDQHPALARRARGALDGAAGAHAPAEQVRALGVDGVVLSNGPGDPEPLARDHRATCARLRRRRDAGASASASATSCSASPSAAGRSSSSSATTAATSRSRTSTAARVSITSQNHGFAVEPPTPAAGLPRHPGQPQRRHRRGLRRRRPAGHLGAVPPRGGAGPARRGGHLRRFPGAGGPVELPSGSLRAGPGSCMVTVWRGASPRRCGSKRRT